MSGVTAEQLNGIISEILAFLEYEPSTRAPMYYLPPRLSDLDPKCRISIDWYDEDKRFGHVFHYHELFPPDSLWIKRRWTYAFSLSFVPWGKWMFFLEEMYTISPEETSFMKALHNWLVKEDEKRVDKQSECADDDIDLALFDLRHDRENVNSLQEWLEATSKAIAFSQAVREAAIIHLLDRKEELDGRESDVPNDCVQ